MEFGGNAWFLHRGEGDCTVHGATGFGGVAGHHHTRLAHARPGIPGAQRRVRWGGSAGAAPSRWLKTRQSSPTSLFTLGNMTAWVVLSFYAAISSKWRCWATLALRWSLRHMQSKVMCSEAAQHVSSERSTCPRSLSSSTSRKDHS